MGHPRAPAVGDEEARAPSGARREDPGGPVLIYTIDQYIEAHIEDVCEPVHMDRVEVTDDTLPAWMVALGDASEFAAFITVTPLDGALTPRRSSPCHFSAHDPTHARDQ